VLTENILELGLTARRDNNKLPILNLDLTAGIPDYATFTRASTATVEDFEGLIKTVKSGEVRDKGARRVENLISLSETFTNDSYWAIADGTRTANQLIAPDGTMTADLMDTTKFYYRSNGQPTVAGLTNTINGNIYLYSDTEITVNISLYAWGGAENDFEAIIPAST